MPKILRIINRFNIGGPTYNAAYLTKYLSNDFETLLVGGKKEESEDSSEYIIRNLGIEPVIIPEMHRSINPRNDLVAYRKIKKIIESYKPDIVHTHASKAGTIGRIAALRSNVPVIIHTFHGHVFHSYFNSYKTKIFQNIEQSLAKKSTKIIAISDLQKKELSEKYNITSANNIEVIPLGFDLDRFHHNNALKRKEFREKYNIDDDELAIGIVGRLVPIKNHDLFLESIKYIKENTSKKIRAFIIGDGESRHHLEKKSKELRLDYVDGTKTNNKATLTYTSWIKNIDFAYAGLDIITLTSLNEGTPVSLIEAQAANKPIVSTNVGGIENVVIPQTTALLSKNDDVNDFSQKLFSLIENDDLRYSLSQKGWQHVHNKFHYSRLVSNTENLYYKLLCG
ncbi:MAG: glycosyltransferase [Bacteroidales bacterium]|nr:glycosyltransferase [Bacteroidales bacterium]